MMHIDLVAITNYALMATGFAGLLFLHFSLLRRFQQLQQQYNDDGGAQRLEMTRLRTEFLESAALRECAPATRAAAAAQGWHGSGPRMNMNRRSQAVRMSRGGDSPERIASALGVPKSEVDLLLKVHRSITTPG